MQLNTMLKVGSLAMNVAQDDKVRELFTMVHQGAKRRGLIGPLSLPPNAMGAPASIAPIAKPTQHPVPFAPPPAKPTAVAGIGDVGQWLSANNAKKALSMAGQVAQLLIK